MSKKTNWAEMDKRIRGRRSAWSNEDLAALDASLKKLPDVADEAELTLTPQPTIGSGAAVVDSASPPGAVGGVPN